MNCPSFLGFTALHIASQHGQTETVQLLLDEGCWIDAQTDAKWTPFMVAIWNEQHHAAEELIKRGANVHLKNEAGNTALSLAAVKHTHLVNLCIKAECDVNTQEYELNWTPLHVASATGKQVRDVLCRQIQIAESICNCLFQFALTSAN